VYRSVGRRQFAGDQSILGDDVFLELVHPASLNYLYRLRPAKNFGLTLVNFKTYDVCYCNRAVACYIDIRAAASPVMFKELLKTHFFKTAFSTCYFLAHKLL